MRLKKSQKEALLKWVAEGLQSDEINGLASDFMPPFSVSRQQVDYYRKTRKQDIEIITREGELDALTTGLSLKAERIKSLKMLAKLMEKDLFGGFLWTDRVKSIGSGDSAIVVEYEEFNKSEVSEYRATLDDIAKEIGDRKQSIEHSGPDGGPIIVKGYETVSPDDWSDGDSKD